MHRGRSSRVTDGVSESWKVMQKTCPGTKKLYESCGAFHNELLSLRTTIFLSNGTEIYPSVEFNSRTSSDGGLRTLEQHEMFFGVRTSRRTLFRCVYTCSSAAVRV